MFRLILIWVCLSAGWVSKAAYDPTDDLLNAFAGSCSSVGAKSLQALQSSALLRNIAESLENDPDCQSLAPNLNALYEKQARMSYLLRPKSTDWRKSQSEARINELVAAIAVETDALVEDSLRSELFNEQLTRIDLGLEKRQVEKELLYNAAGDFLSFSQNTLASLAKNTACIEKRPGIPLQVVGQVLAVGSSLVSSPLGPALFGMGNAINDLAGYFLDRKYRRYIKKASMIRLGPALGCAIESLASNYCQARDTIILADSNANNDPAYKADTAGGDWKGLQILSRDIEPFNAWIQRVSAGARPSNPASADQKVEGNNVEAAFKNAIDKMAASVVFNREKEKNAPDSAKVNIRRGTVIELSVATADFVFAALDAGSVHSNGVSSRSPFYDTFIYDPECGPTHYFMTGRFEISGTKFGGSRSCEDYEDTQVPTFDTLEQRLDGLIERASVDVANRVALVKENDFSTVLAKFHTAGGSSASPEIFFGNLNAYLTSLLVNHRSHIPSYVEKLIRDTLNRLDLAESAIHNPQELSLEDVVTEVQIQLSPKQEQLFIFKRVEELVRWDLIHRLNSGKLQDNVNAILRDSLNNSLTLVEQVGLFNLEGLRKDAEGAQTLTVRNIDLLGEMFRGSFESYLKSLNQLYTQLEVPSVLQDQRWFCMQLALLPNLNQLTKSRRSLVAKLCTGQVFTSVYKHSNLQLKFDDLVREPFESRVCSIYDFNRKSRIFGFQKGL